MPDDDFEQRLSALLNARAEDSAEPFDAGTVAARAISDAMQRGPLGGPRRNHRMTLPIPRPARYWAMAAIGLTALLFGVGMVLSRPTNTASPSTVPTPATSATPNAEPPRSFDGWLNAQVGGDSAEYNLTPGSYYIDQPAGHRVTFQVGSGWWPWRKIDQRAVVLDDGAVASGFFMEIAQVGRLYADPCDDTAGFLDPASSSSVDDIVRIFTSWDTFTTGVEPATIGGLPATKVDLVKTVSDEACPFNDDGTGPNLFETPGGVKVSLYLGYLHRENQAYVLEIGGTPTVILVTDYSESSIYEEINDHVTRSPQLHADQQADLRRMVDSLTIE